jgi:phosphatidylinositol alpha-1,6-mannosyltransferase
VGYKNVGAVIEALAKVRHRTLKLMVVGEGPERAPLEKQAQSLSLDSHVVFAGRLAAEDLRALYRGALAYVFASRREGGLRHEGVGMAALEAAACRTAVIASTETSAADFVRDGETGYVFDPSDAAALAATVERLLDSPSERDAVAERASRLVLDRYTWRRTADAVLNAIGILSPKALP